VLIHSLFDCLAVLAAMAVYRLVPIGVAGSGAAPWRRHPLYLTAAAAGATVGAYLFGSLNLGLSGTGGVARSVEGALAGAILAIELLKAKTGIRGSTGVRLAAPLAAAIAVGRLGCHFAGIDDMTYGSPTSLPWGVDNGDGIPRHPVQLLESAAMVIFVLLFLMLLRRGSPLVLRAGFYLFVGVYAAQRFVLEFLKPYGTIIGPFDLFHLLSFALLAYALIFARRELRASWTLPPSTQSLRA
jgi:prolipoprotein diacylglyceryltransferase